MSESDLDPDVVLDLVARDVPAPLHENLLIVGSLAAAYHHREGRAIQTVRTKDADVIVQPAGALRQCRDVAERLLDAGWRRTDKCHPCADSLREEDLRVIRLHPPSNQVYFVELLGLPEAGQVEPRRMVPVELRDGWYVVPCFRYMAVLTGGRLRARAGLQYAAPSMMALANLLAHPRLGTAPIGGTDILRSAKDLGRALALYLLASDAELETWATAWWAAINEHFAQEAVVLAQRAGSGIRELLESSKPFNDAFELVSQGLLIHPGTTSHRRQATSGGGSLRSGAPRGGSVIGLSR